ncbi:hypothetical protein [Niastella populi]|uniref:Uncharacterized protein n=1 Tax=Niastella populi TaxID=550983 RepID=A0A1V9GBA1_9BACT|nr:hypothetical protein [Niastella populi]OQP67850.1 hypothetical protein A4R26_10105 [Niastella populi]
MDFRKLDNKLRVLAEKTSSYLLLPLTADEWKDVFDLISEIKEGFKEVRYQTITEKNSAWQNFYALREKAYRKRQEDFENKSKEHFRKIWHMLDGLEYSRLEDFIISTLSFQELKITKETMRERGKELNEAAQYFSSVKGEMTKEHKAEIHERIIKIRINHDEFWKETKDREQELAQVRKEKQEAWEEKREKSLQIKERIKNNLNNNRDKLAKAEEALQRFESTKMKLEEKVESAYTERYREQHQEWLEEIEQKIRSVKDQIENLERWIQEDEQKLNNWSD